MTFLTDAISITADHDLHEMRRKAVANYFSRPNLTRVESRIHHEAKILVEKLREIQGTGKVVALDHAFSAYTGDLVGQFTCGEHPKLLEGPDFSPQWCALQSSWQTPKLTYCRHKSLMGVLRVVPIMRNLGWLSYLLKLIPVSLLTALNPEVAGFRMFTLVSGSGDLFSSTQTQD